MCMKITIFHSIPFRSEFLLLLQRVVSGLSSSLHVYYKLTLATAALYCIRRSLRRWCIVEMLFALFVLTMLEL